MPLIKKPKQPSEKKQFRIRVIKEAYEEVKAYCDWLEIEFDHFFEQAAIRVLEKDKDWKERKKEKPETKSETITA